MPNTRIEWLVALNQILEDEINAELKTKFPDGSEVVFKFGNMNGHANGIVRWARLYCGSAYVGVTNTRTGRDRDIPMTAILIEPDEATVVNPGDTYTTTRKDRLLVKRMRKLGAADSEIAKSLGIAEDSPIIVESRS